MFASHGVAFLRLVGPCPTSPSKPKRGQRLGCFFEHGLDSGAGSTGLEDWTESMICKVGLRWRSLGWGCMEDTREHLLATVTGIALFSGLGSAYYSGPIRRIFDPFLFPKANTRKKQCFSRKNIVTVLQTIGNSYYPKCTPWLHSRRGM